MKAFNKIKRKAKINYFKTILEENKNNTKQIWKVLKKAIGKENNKKNFPQSFNIENKYLENAKSCKALVIMYINNLILFTFS